MTITRPYLSGLTLFYFIIACFLLPYSSPAQKKSDYHLIAHRGGVVDEKTAENSAASIRRAIANGYWMVEIDVRLTRDKELVIHHDKNFKRYYGVDSLVEEMNWKDIKKLKSSLGGGVLKLEDALKLCSGKIGVMIDNKIKGNDTTVWNRLIGLLKKYRLYKNALTIGTDESTEFFTGRIRLSCTRKQLEENMQKSGYQSSNYFLFSGDITREDAEWAADHNILAVGVLNRWAIRDHDDKAVKERVDKLLSTGVKYFQIDSEFERYFR